MSDILITEDEANEICERLEELAEIKKERNAAVENSVFADNLKALRDLDPVEEEEETEGSGVNINRPDLNG